VRALGFDVAPQLVIEVDGAVKYTRPDGSASVESVISEKHRESALRDLGYGLVRLDHRSLQDPEQVRQRIYAAASRASPSLRRASARNASLLHAPAAR
jgi:very-short-patch-repair endonuclease